MQHVIVHARTVWLDTRHPFLNRIVFISAWGRKSRQKHRDASFSRGCWVLLPGTAACVARGERLTTFRIGGETRYILDLTTVAWSKAAKEMKGKGRPLTIE